MKGSCSLPMRRLLYEESENDDEYVQMLFGRERHLGFGRNEALVFGDWMKRGRLESITWALKAKALFGFRLRTAYLAITYLDRFISRRSIDIDKPWAVQLLSVACLSLAAKMEELNIPRLSEFQTEDYHFESAVIQRMELLVLSTLEWRMDSITPFAFIHYFIRKLHHEHTLSVSTIAHLILPIITDMDLIKYRPSVIALAATLVALDHRLTTSALEFKINNISCGFLQIDHVIACYQLLQAREADKNQVPNVMYTPDLLPTHLRPHDTLQNPPVNPSTSKRKRLSFNNCDQNRDMPNEKKMR